MAHRAPAVAVAALLGTVLLGASAADPPRPLRTLTYAVDVAVSNVLDTTGGGMPNGTRTPIVVKGRTIGQSSNIGGSGDKRASHSVAAQGSITVQVIQATDDAGLVVDVWEETAKRVRPKVRVAIAGDGALFFDPANGENLSEEELAIVHWLGRGFYGDHPTEIGTSWTVDQSSNGHVDVEHYRVLAREEHHVTLDYALEEKTGGARGYAGSREGSLVYDTAMVVPVKAAFESIARRQLGPAFDTLRTSVKLTLTGDTFTPRSR